MRSAVLQSVFGEQKPDEPDEQRLEALFSNRIELKKSYAELRLARDVLADQLTAEQEKSRRLTLQLEYLEKLLTDGDTAVSTMLFYHLRGLWRRCSKRLTLVAEDMSRRTTGRRQVFQIERWQKEQKQRIADCAARMEAKMRDIDALKDEIAKLAPAPGRKLRWWQRWRRDIRGGRQQELAATLKQQIVVYGQLSEQHKQLRLQRADVDAALTIEDKRLINLHLIALAQFLCAHFAEHGIVDKAEAAMRKDVGSIEFGDDADCERIRHQAEEAFAALVKLEQTPAYRSHIVRQANHMAKFCQYPSPSAVVPDRFDPANIGADAETGILVVSDAFADPSSVVERDLWSMSSTFLR